MQGEWRRDLPEQTSPPTLLPFLPTYAAARLLTTGGRALTVE